jgi:hypothetical protein
MTDDSAPVRRAPWSAAVLGFLLVSQVAFILYTRNSVPPGSKRPGPAPAVFTFRPRIAAASGDVEIVSQLGRRRAKREETLSEREAIETGDDGRCILEIDGRAELLLGPASRIEMNPRPDARGGALLFLRSGTAYAAFREAGSGAAGDTRLVLIQTPNLVVGPERNEPTEFLLSVE